jgi:hypothetical protein
MQTVDWNKPIQTRDGQPARLVTVIKGVYGHVVVVNEGSVIKVTSAGLFQGEPYTDPLDIINVPPKKRTGEAWLNVYPDDAAVHDTRALADTMANPNRIACVRVQWTEGEGLGGL